MKFLLLLLLSFNLFAKEQSTQFGIWDYTKITDNMTDEIVSETILGGMSSQLGWIEFSCKDKKFHHYSKSNSNVKKILVRIDDAKPFYLSLIEYQSFYANSLSGVMQKRTYDGSFIKSVAEGDTEIRFRLGNSTNYHVSLSSFKKAYYKSSCSPSSLSKWLSN